MNYTLKEIRTAILVVSVLCKNPETPEPLRVVLESTRDELVKWFLYLQKEDKNVQSTSSKTKNQSAS